MSHKAMSELSKDARSMRALRKLVKEGAVRIQVLHKYGCCTYYTAIHPCDCGQDEKEREVKKLVGIGDKERVAGE